MGPPSEGLFLPGTFPRVSPGNGTGNLLTNLRLPLSRLCLEPLRLLSLTCLSWEPAHRPTAHSCSDSIQKWLSTSDPAPSFADLWLQHSSQLPAKPNEYTQATPAQETKQDELGNDPALVEAAAFALAYASDQKLASTTTSNLTAGLKGRKSDPDATKDPDPTGTSSLDSKRKQQTCSTSEVSDRCACERSHCNWHRQRCTNPALAGSVWKFCVTCTCREEDCDSMQLNKSGYCYNHSWRVAPPALQLVRALGAAVSPASLSRELCPANLIFFRQACSDYVVTFESLDPVFEVVAAWLDHPRWVEAWSDNKLPPNSNPEALVTALLKTIRQMSSDPTFLELSQSESSFLACCSWLGIIEEIPAGSQTVPSEDLWCWRGAENKTWLLIKVPSNCQ